eukprot:scaffold243470_cov36-Prasinocladus_malaysianus.AAC.1
MVTCALGYSSWTAMAMRWALLCRILSSSSDSSLVGSSITSASASASFCSGTSSLVADAALVATGELDRRAFDCAKHPGKPTGRPTDGRRTTRTGSLTATAAARACLGPTPGERATIADDIWLGSYVHSAWVVCRSRFCFCLLWVGQLWALSVRRVVSCELAFCVCERTN